MRAPRSRCVAVRCTSIKEFQMHRVKQVVWSAVAAMALCVSGAARADNHVLELPPTGNAALSIAHDVIQNAPAQAGAMTIEFWIRCDSIAAVHGNALAKRGCSNSGYTIQVRPDGSMHSELGGVSDFGASFPLQQWAHFATVWSRASNTVSIFVNGTLARTEVAFGPNLEELNTELRFGEYCGRSMAGALDNVRIWSVARTQAEINANKSRQFTPPEAAATPGLVGAWSFESGDGLSDDAGRNPTGVLQGGASVGVDNAVPVDPTANTPGYARFAATSDTIRINGNTAFNQGDFTYEMRIRLAPGAQLGHVISEQRDTFEDKTLQLAADGGFIASGCGENGNTGNITGTIPGFPASQWMHLAYVHQGANLKFYVNGSLVMTRLQGFCFTDRSDSWMSLGMFRYGAGWIPTDAFPSFLGDLDWIRVSSGARYTANFAPPYECEVTADAGTQLLLKFNEPAGSTTLVDESVNRFICELGVPVAPGVQATSPTLGNSEGAYPVCRPPCPGDVDGSGSVNGVDLAVILTNWGTPSEEYPNADTNDDGVVDGSDLAAVLAGWGACP
jgi:hypothetical protein